MESTCKIRKFIKFAITFHKTKGDICKTNVSDDCKKVKQIKNTFREVLSITTNIKQKN